MRKREHLCTFSTAGERGLAELWLHFRLFQQGWRGRGVRRARSSHTLINIHSTYFGWNDLDLINIRVL